MQGSNLSLHATSLNLSQNVWTRTWPTLSIMWWRLHTKFRLLDLIDQMVDIRPQNSECLTQQDWLSPETHTRTNYLSRMVMQNNTMVMVGLNTTSVNNVDWYGLTTIRKTLTANWYATRKLWKCRTRIESFIARSCCVFSFLICALNPFGRQCPHCHAPNPTIVVNNSPNWLIEPTKILTQDHIASRAILPSTKCPSISPWQMPWHGLRLACSSREAAFW